MAEQMPRRDVTGTQESLRLLRALAHPLRRRIMREVGYYGSVNSASLAKALGESTGTTSYHLRQLADAGLIEEVPGSLDGRERWWRGIPQDIRMPPRSQMTPETRAVAEELDRLRIADDIELYLRALAERDTTGGKWLASSRAGMHMTAEELHAFFEEYIALLQRHGHPAEEAPPGSRALAVRFFVAPLPPPDGVPEDRPSGEAGPAER